MNKYLFICGSRGEWGYIRPIIDIFRKKKIKYSIIATNMLLLSSHGKLVNEIKKEGYNVSDEIFMSLEGSNYFSMTKSLSVLLNSLVDIIVRIKPTWFILAGDRGEQLMGAVAAAYTYTPLAHIQAGERSGNIDGVTRHAIAKFVHLHFSTNLDATNRLLKSGEEKFRVKQVGAPQLDEIKNKKFLNYNSLIKIYGEVIKKKYILVIFHPVTEEFKNIKKQIKILISSLKDINLKKIWIFPNNDAGSEIIKNEILHCRDVSTSVYSNLSREHYLSLMKYSEFIIGNSSSGLIEAPSFAKPAINIGRRQQDRVRGGNVIDSKFDKSLIKRAIKKACSKKFRDKITQLKNPYGDGNSSYRILKILENLKIDDKLLVKRMTY
jgi:GDP/UDP-N,N'-diacetylbacillosamine 2-epimerase (hydrolysing)